MSTASFYKWRSKYGGMDASMISQMRSLEDENRRLKKMYAEMSGVHPVQNGGINLPTLCDVLASITLAH